MPIFRPAAFALGAALLAASAAAQDNVPATVGSFAGWTVYMMPDGARDACYAVASPSRPDAADANRHKPNLMVTHRPGEKIYNVVSVDLGTDLPANGSADVAIGRTSFDFFTKDHTAWSRDADTDKAVVTAMAAGNEFAIKAKLPKGRVLADTYSLQGFSQALAALDKACKYRR